VNPNRRPDRLVERRLPPLVLTGGPATGKSTTGRALARGCARGAFVDVDDVRQLVVSGGATVWEGAEGVRQWELAARNACALAVNLWEAGFDVVVADVLDRRTAAVYRQLLPGALIVHLVVSLTEARRRAATRRVWLTDDEFAWLHERDRREPPDADVRLELDGVDEAGQLAAVRGVWR
jgi:hypothetical protein